jgi:hypothetical protein
VGDRRRFPEGFLGLKRERWARSRVGGLGCDWAARAVSLDGVVV